MASKKIFLPLCLAILLSGVAVRAVVDPVPGGATPGGSDPAPAAPRITGINFRGTSDPARLVILANGPIQVEKQVNTQDKQLILNISGATLARGMSRKIDTSSFNSNVTLISPYQTKDGSVRIVVQLRQNVEVAMSQSGNQLNLSVPSKAGPAPAGAGSASGAGDAVAATSAAPASGDASAAASPSSGASSGAGADAPGGPAASADPDSAAPSASAPPKDSMDTFLDNSKSKQFTGRPITLQLRDVDVADVFHLISEASGFNIVLGSDVKGKLTLSLTEVPWDQALDVVLQTMNLGAERRGNVLRIVTLEDLANEKILELKTKIAEENLTPKIERVFPISYADLKALKKMILDLAESDATGAQKASPALAALTAQGGGKGAANLALKKQDKTENTVGGVTVIADERTNSLIVKAIPKTMERIRKMIDLLDTQTPEVLLDAKVVEASESFGDSINGSLGFGNLSIPAFGSMNQGVAIDPLLAAPQNPAFQTNLLGANYTPGTPANTPGGYIGVGSNVLGTSVNAILNAAVNESKAKVISSPRTVVLDKKSAKILQETPVLVPQPTIGQFGSYTMYNIAVADLSLEAVPTVTSDGSILMHLTIHRDIVEPAAGSGTAAQEAVAQRYVTTDVLVDSGATLVLGGFYTADQTDQSAGFPILKDIPILGWFFSGQQHNHDRDEMFFFITPQILNPKKAGIAS